jgi:DNA primase
MAKISLVSAKYIIQVGIFVEGAIDKPDVIGAIFGQTEGLLGSDLELRELQRSGRIGRIEVNLDVKMGKTKGSIIVPSSLDKVETAIIAAALETIQRIGPCNSNVKVEKIEDVRISKRDQVISRAQELLKTLTTNVLPDSQEMTELVAKSLRMTEITEYGPDRLHAGPGIDEAEDVTLVEGRADVLNLLRHGFKNVVALGGTHIPNSIMKLSKEKTTTLFVDGDRGGDLILKGLLNVGIELDFVTRALDGKEVEELTKKEIHKALRAKITAEQVKYDVDPEKISTSGNNIKKSQQRVTEAKRYNNASSNRSTHSKPVAPTRPATRPVTRPAARPVARPVTRPVAKPTIDKKKAKELTDDLVGSRAALLLDKDLNALGKVPLSELAPTLRNIDNVNTLILDGDIDKILVTNAEKAKVQNLIGNEVKVRKQDTRVNLFTAKEL